MSAPAPTLRSLAKTLGLSRTTVSDALRGSPRVDPATAARVKIAAAAAGYLRNPLAGALMSELRRSRGGSFRGVLAAVDFDEPDRPASAAHFHHELVLGAETRGAALGFKVEKIIVGRGAVSVPRLDSILKARGIKASCSSPRGASPTWRLSIGRIMRASTPTTSLNARRCTRSAPTTTARCSPPCNAPPPSVTNAPDCICNATTTNASISLERRLSHLPAAPPQHQIGTPARRG